MIRIKEVIKEKGLTVAKVAELMGVQQTSLSRIINGGNTTLEMLEKIAAALDVPVAELLQSESELFGLVVFKGKTYKIDSDQALQTFLNDYNSGVS
jgi:transcriptional regulator with XRE-family HTH domain